MTQLPPAEHRGDLNADGALMHTEIMSLNVGPQHPSTHGVLRLVVDMDGEFVTKVVPHMGYLHTGFEKTMENRTYQQNMTYAPRTDYLHSFSHELATCSPRRNSWKPQRPSAPTS